MSDFTNNGMSIYTDNGYGNRAIYLMILAVKNGVDIRTVRLLADSLGPSEDFDGLVAAVEDIAAGYYQD